MNTKETFSLTIVRDEKRSRVTIEGVVPKDKIEAVYPSVVAQAGQDQKIDGFREGKVPASVVETKVGSFELWRKSAHTVVMDVFPTIVLEEKLVPLGMPALQLTSIADKGDAQFKIEFATMPVVEIPEYATALKDVAPLETETEATKEEVQMVLHDVRRSLYKKAHPEKSVPEDDAVLPEITDEYIREITNQYKDLASFTEGIKESINREKKVEARSKFRQRILDALLEHTQIVVPENVIEEESKRAHEEMKSQAKALNTSVEEYLKANEMTEEQLWEQLRTDAEKRSQVQFVLSAIGNKEEIYADPAEIDREMNRFKDRVGGAMTEDQMRVYLESLLSNEAVIQFLEKQVAARG